jgi:hypothetical protein
MTPYVLLRKHCLPDKEAPASGEEASIAKMSMWQIRDRESNRKYGSSSMHGKSAPALETTVSTDTTLRIRFLFEHAFITQAAQIDSLETPLIDQLCDPAACCWSVHHPVPRKTGDNVKVLVVANPVADDRIAIQFASLVKPRPGAVTLRAFKGSRKAVCQGWPDHFQCPGCAV